MAVPDRSRSERSDALNRALYARRRRAEIKEALRNRELDFPGIIELAEEDPVVGRTKVVDALCALPRVGPKTALRIMTQAEISESRRIKGLGPRQREDLLAIVTATVRNK